MAANVYEGMYILDSNRYLRDPEAASNSLEAMITKAGGEILVSRLWEERRLAYPIKAQRKGTYWLIYFRLGSNELTPIKRQCEIDDNILRTLFLKVDPRLVDAVVAHAQSATPSLPPPVEVAPVAKAPVAVPVDLDGDEGEGEER